MLFNYNTLKVELDKDTRSISILLNRPEKMNAINMEMIFELESLFSWLTAHLEINSVLLSSTSDYFCNGFDRNELEKMDEEKFKKYLLRFQKIIYCMLHLPQTIVCDLKAGCSEMGIELALGSDIRVSHEDSHIQFDFLKRGLVPTCGAIGLLTAMVGNSFARNWIFSSKPITRRALKRSGFIHENYKMLDNECALSILRQIALQAPVARIQAKRAFLESILPDMDRALKYEPQFSFAGLSTGDWKKSVEAEKHGYKAEYISARDVSIALKKEVLQE